jgi:signal transduction histidine kinase
MGLASAMRWYIEGFRERSGVEVELEMPAEFARLHQSVEMVVFRVLQESLTNLHRHSGSKTARVRFTVDSENAIVSVQDEGKGFGDSSEQPQKVGVGVASMRERVRRRIQD